MAPKEMIDQQRDDTSRSYRSPSPCEGLIRFSNPNFRMNAQPQSERKGQRGAFAACRPGKRFLHLAAISAGVTEVPRRRVVGRLRARKVVDIESGRLVEINR